METNEIVEFHPGIKEKYVELYRMERIYGMYSRNITYANVIHGLFNFPRLVTVSSA